MQKNAKNSEEKLQLNDYYLFIIYINRIFVAALNVKKPV
ncbi:hypothetical protein SAMN05192529_13430 [Arachidicoccus rhizosphaerae]|uniref:Uncharacterized protein n=1 Tax=Arachidicoccus rhizosphaerae TaxID=551991 RepID=A0A1H4CPN1_9BACT|nr:hypothetical protein SAMN05192529_13430 [Arachidicoccus rhizosphaerae]